MSSDELPTTTERKDDDAHEIDLRRYLVVLRKRAWVIAATIAVGITAAVLFTMRQPRIYQASASVVINPRPPQVFGNQVQEVIQLGADSYWANKEYYNTQVDILGSYDLARITVETHRLYENPLLLPPQEAEDLTEREKIDAATEAFAENLRATQNPESRVVRVKVRHTSEELSIQLANLHVQTFLAYTRGLRTEGSGNVSDFLSTELQDAEKRLRASEEELYTFKKDNDILSVSLEDKQNIISNDIARYTAALADSRIKRIELEAMRRRTRNLSMENLLESPLFSLASATSSIELIKAQYRVETRALTDLAEELGPKHPRYVSQQKKVAALEDDIRKEAQRARSELDERYRIAVETERHFGTEVERLKKEAFELGPKTVAYNRLARKQKSDEENYNLVLGRLRATDLSSRNKEINVRPHETARSAKLVSPRIKLNIAIAAMIALLFGLVIAFVLEYLDRTVKSAEDIEAAVGAPLLGVIPVVDMQGPASDPATLRARDLYVFENPTSQAAECCRSLRTNILFSSADRKMKTITISSPKPREGKSTSTIYLGTTMAQSGQKVLLIDTDLRRPRLHRSMGVSRERGLTNLILGNADIDDVIKTTDVPNMYVLPCGPQPPNPAELLLTSRFKEVLDELTERFDRVLLDSPPLLAVTDAVVLARLSDGVLLVSQAGKTLIDDAKQAARSLNDVDAAILGVVLNDLDLSNRRYGYYYYSYSYSDAAEAGQAS